ncbi:peptidoglycan recognition family protein [Paracoccus cavernae]|uniref:Peptidoglycan recognition family protein n=1 Tax=Paracoccus cavernae TaxID=1571207 RepID=A0ABT8D9L2_9RHOB|nr:peptidoglycan recognition family protein [Paracoccus cavernae]
MDGIILHWTAGADGVTHHEADSYNFLIGRDGTITPGKHAPEAQIPPLRKGSYAAHTLNANGNRIGVALDAMGDANERPFRAGRFPITELQLDVLVTFVADLCLKYRIPVTRRTVLSHAEVQPTLGIRQNGKWDISWLPGMAAPAIRSRWATSSARGSSRPWASPRSSRSPLRRCCGADPRAMPSAACKSF